MELGPVEEMAQIVSGCIQRRDIVQTRFAEFAEDPTVASWVQSGEGSIEEITHIISTRDERKHELETQLAARGLTLRRDSELCRRYILAAVGDVEEIVTCMSEMDWFFRCTGYERLRYVDDDSDSEDRYSDDDWDRRGRVDSERGKELALNGWITKLLEKYGDGILSPETFSSHLSAPDTPPLSLHPTIISLIEEKVSKTCLSKALKILPKVDTFASVPAHLFQPLWGSVVDDEIWKQAKELYVHG